tara:strand:- start:829 stop:1350 length:522 start_codon:yes stop_codon:yes gene_type:complete
MFKASIIFFFIIVNTCNAQAIDTTCINKKITQRFSVLEKVYNQDTLIFAIVCPELLLYSEGQYELESFLLYDFITYDFSLGPFQMKRAFISSYVDNSKVIDFRKYLDLDNQMHIMRRFLEMNNTYSTTEKIQIYNSGSAGHDYIYTSLKCSSLTYNELSEYIVTYMKVLHSKY